MTTYLLSYFNYPMPFYQTTNPSIILTWIFLDGCLVLAGWLAVVHCDFAENPVRIKRVYKTCAVQVPWVFEMKSKAMYNTA